jgi:ATP-dependent exoDNAse (exonuclease V) alpha subunit
MLGHPDRDRRQLMDADGRLGKDRLRIAEREFATGDGVVCLRNSDQLAVKNGTTGTVQRIDTERRTLTVATDRGPAVELNRRYLENGNVRHAYALTGHAAQGLTVERAFVLGAGEARLQEWGYVALSRAREKTRLYVTGTPREHESHQAPPAYPTALGTPERGPMEAASRWCASVAGSRCAVGAGKS